MEIRKVQKTGDMHYLYLPTSWCKKNRINSGANIALDQLDDGSLSVIPRIVETPSKHLNIKLTEFNEDILKKVVIACYISPASSFKIDPGKNADVTPILNQKKIISLESVELDKNMITCESTVSISDPASLLKTMVRKIKNLLTIMVKDYNLELINRYEEEIDRNNLLIEKSIVGFLTFSASPKHKVIDLHYISLVSRELEELSDHLVSMDKKETGFFSQASEIIDLLDAITGSSENINYINSVQMIKKIEKMKKREAEYGYSKKRILYAFLTISEIILDWAVTKQVEAC